MRFGAWHFCPGRASTIAVLLLLPVLLMLGYWQLDRAAQKAELQTTFAKRFAQPPVDLTGVDPADSSNRYLHVVASGRYDGAHQMLLDNQVHDGQPGYHVLTPLRMAGDAILIDRGWVPLGESRQVLPDIGASTDDITIGGWLAQPPSPGLRLGDAAGADQHWPRVVPYVDYQRLSAILGYPLQPAVILLVPEAPGGYWRDWRPQFGGFGPERHRGYAVQWFALAVALIILYIFASVRRLPRSE
ncbi:MAG: SURF1 family protein [Candidatus Competibacteraceae bacterium]|nr:MAG: SURF1 family protein [Candidatus Competibacteraceae bacterium]